MTESSSLIPIRDVYEISKELLGYGYDAIGFLFPEVASKVTARKANNLIRIMRSAQAKLDEAKLKPEEREAVSLKLGLPFIEKASLEEDPTLQELWANLLANALNPNHSTEIRTIFVDIIQNLSAFDVLVLNAFHISRHPLVPSPQNIVQVYTKEGYKPYPSKTVENCLHILMGLNLATDMAPTSQLQLGNFNAVQETEVHLTPLGILFVDACIKDASQ